MLLDSKISQNPDYYEFERIGNMKNVSIIMPTFNKARMLDLTLLGFKFQEYKDFEIVIVDDGSSDNTIEVVKEYEKKLDIKYIYQENTGRAGARNTALKAAIGNYIIFNDDDRIPCRQFLQKHIEQLMKNECLITFGEKHELLTCYSDKLQLKIKDLMNFFKSDQNRLKDIIFANGKELFDKNDLIKNFEQVLNKWDFCICFDTYVDIYKDMGNDLKEFGLAFMVATTANLGYNRKKFPDVKFDENYRGWGMEDTDFVYQLDIKGCEYLFLPEAKNYHQIHERSSDLLVQLYTNIRYFCIKYSNIRSFLFSAVCKQIIGMGEANESLKEIEKNPNSLLAQSYINLCEYMSKQ